MGSLLGPLMGSRLLTGRSWTGVRSVQCADRVIGDRADDCVVTPVDHQHERDVPPVPQFSRQGYLPVAGHLGLNGIHHLIVYEACFIL